MYQTCIFDLYGRLSISVQMRTNWSSGSDWRCFMLITAHIIMLKNPAYIRTTDGAVKQREKRCSKRQSRSVSEIRIEDVFTEMFRIKRSLCRRTAGAACGAVFRIPFHGTTVPL